MSCFDEQPDGDPHGECAAEIESLRAQVALLQAAIRKAQLKVPLGMEHDGCWWILQEALETEK